MYKRATEEGLKAGADRLQFNAKPLENKTLYLCFRDNEQGRSWKRLFNAGLAQIDVEVIMEGYLDTAFD